MNVFKKIVSLCIAMSLMLYPLGNTFAASFDSEKNDYAINYSSDEMYDFLLSVGFSTEEIFALYQDEANLTGNLLDLPSNLAETVGVDASYYRSES